jgi:membrane protein DedA with SNARE-associated domain
VLTGALLLFGTALLHEDVAILGAGLLATEGRLPVGALYALVYAGVLLNNSTVYALGAAARRLPRLRRWLIHDNVEKLRRRLERGLLPALALCRFVPGVLTPTLLGCGWLGIPFDRFVVAAALAAGAYLALALTLVLVIGETVLRYAGDNHWLLFPALAVVAMVVYWKLVRSRKSGSK